MGYGRNYGRRGYSRPQAAGRIAKANARPGPCRYCGLEIPANRGQLWRGEDGSWSVVHVQQEWRGSPVSGHYVGGCPQDTDELNREGGWGKYAAQAASVQSAYVSGVTGARMSGSRGRCEDAPCCGCCD